MLKEEQDRRKSRERGRVRDMVVKKKTITGGSEMNDTKP